MIQATKPLKRVVVIYTPGLPGASWKESVLTACKARGLDPSTIDLTCYGDARALPKGLHVDVLAGFSAGGHRVRDALASGAEPLSIVIADGTHYRDPKIAAAGGQAMPIEPWRHVISRALAGEGPRVFVSHTYLTYTDQIVDDPRTKTIERPFASTVKTLRELTGWALDEPRDRRGVSARAQNKLTVYSHESGAADAAAHGRQLTEHLPRMIASALVALEADVDDTSEAAPAEPEPEDDEELTRAQRLLAWAGAEIAKGVQEEPLGSNDGPRIREYRENVTYWRRDANTGREERILPTPGWAYCAMAVCCGLDEVTIDEVLPALPFNRVSGVELVRDAEEVGTLANPNEPAQPGWIAVWPRATPGAASASWERHVTIVLCDNGEPGGCVCVGANEGVGKWSPAEGVQRPGRPLAVIKVK